jgi:hypothetical protein
LCSGAQAQVNVTFLSFEGAAVILDNPPSPTCVSEGGYSFGENFVITYRHTLNPAMVADSLGIVRQIRIARITSTQTPKFSLNGPSTANWDGINGRPGYFTLTGSKSDLTIVAANGSPITMATQEIKMTGTINDFELNAGCNVTIQAALVRRPN